MSGALEYGFISKIASNDSACIFTTVCFWFYGMDKRKAEYRIFAPYNTYDQVCAHFHNMYECILLKCSSISRALLDNDPYSVVVHDFKMFNKEIRLPLVSVYFNLLLCLQQRTERIPL